MFVPRYIQRQTNPCSQHISVVPIMVGHLSGSKLKTYGETLAPYLRDPSTAFVISSDFCHWGSRFSFTFHRPSESIAESIEYLDQTAMSVIETLDLQQFDRYLKEYRSTICGQNPIRVLLATVQAARSLSRTTNPVLRFTHYERSNNVVFAHESSVSYAAAYLTL